MGENDQTSIHPIEKLVGFRLVPETTILYWMFGETTIFYIMIWNPPVETAIKKWLFAVPGELYLEDLLTNSPPLEVAMAPFSEPCHFLQMGHGFYSPKSHAPKRRSLKGKINFLNFCGSCKWWMLI